MLYQSSGERMKEVKVHITHSGNGPAYNIQVKDLQTGRYLAARSLSLTVGPGDWDEPFKVFLEVNHPIIDLIADAEIRSICPCCGREVEDTD
jgi:hypothetical protein